MSGAGRSEHVDFDLPKKQKGARITSRGVIAMNLLPIPPGTQCQEVCKKESPQTLNLKKKHPMFIASNSDYLVQKDYVLYIY